MNINDLIQVWKEELEELEEQITSIQREVS